MFKEKNDLNTQLKILIRESEYLIGENDVSEQQFNKFKSQIHQILAEIIHSDLDDDVKKNAFKALKPYKGKSKINFIPFNWIYRVLLFKLAWDLNMPFLIGKSKSDMFKSQIFKIKMQIEAIDFKLNNSNCFIKK